MAAPATVRYAERYVPEGMTEGGRLLTDRHVLPPFNYGHSSARRRTQLVQRSMTAIFPSSWRSPAAGVKLLSRSICSALSSMRSAAMFSSTRARESSQAACGHGSNDSCTDRKSTRLNSSHGYISYAVFCLKKKKHHI